MTEETKVETAKEEDVKQVVMTTRVKEILHEGNMHSSAEFSGALNEYVIEACKKAMARCKSNGRMTVKPSDL